MHVYLPQIDLFQSNEDQKLFSFLIFPLFNGNFYFKNTNLTFLYRSLHALEKIYAMPMYKLFPD